MLFIFPSEHYLSVHFIMWPQGTTKLQVAALGPVHMLEQDSTK